jgi:hypothetical protein
MRTQKLINEIIDWHEQMRRTLSGAEMIRAIEDQIDRETDPVKRWWANVLLVQEHTTQGNDEIARELGSGIHTTRSTIGTISSRCAETWLPISAPLRKESGARPILCR